jgi:hypothetical protein
LLLLTEAGGGVAHALEQRATLDRVVEALHQTAHRGKGRLEVACLLVQLDEGPQQPALDLNADDAVERTTHEPKQGVAICSAIGELFESSSDEADTGVGPALTKRGAEPCERATQVASSDQRVDLGDSDSDSGVVDAN